MAHTRLYTSPPKFSQAPGFIHNEAPIYRLREDIYTDDTQFLRGATLETTDDFEPNLAMFPINEKAVEKYRAFLTMYDERGRAFAKQEKKAYTAKLPAFEKEWEKVNNLSRQRGIHLVHAVDSAPSILGAPHSGERKVKQVDMSMVPNVPFEDGTAVGKGNTADKDMSAPNVVRQSVAG